MDDIKAAHDKHRNENWEELPWKAWGSWFSWGSPVGLGIFWALASVSTGIFLFLLHAAGLIG